MSRTDKDRPWWVINHQDHNDIDHDHRNGICVEETLELAKFYAGGRGYRPKHKCKKVVRVDFECYPRKVNGKRQILFTVEVPESPYPWNRYHDKNRKKSCWSETCDCGHAPDAWTERYYCQDKYRTECFGHWYSYRDNSINCDCDNWPKTATCNLYARDTRGGYSRYTWGGVPNSFVRTNYHKPERARERELKNMVREYNAYGDIEDSDFFNRQARNSSHWYYW